MEFKPTVPGGLPFDFIKVSGRYWFDSDGYPWYLSNKDDATYVRVDDPNEQAEVIIEVRAAYIKKILRTFAYEVLNTPDEDLSALEDFISFDTEPTPTAGPVAEAYDRLVNLMKTVGRYDRAGKEAVRPAIVRPKKRKTA